VRGPEIRYASSSAGQVAFQVVGDAALDLVFLAEWWNDIELMWDEPLLSDVLDRFSSFSRLICFSPRGVGISDPLPLGSTPALDDWVDDLRAVMDGAASERPVLVACSGSGPLAVIFAAEHPERVGGLVLVNSFARFARAADYPAGVPPEVVELALYSVQEQWGTGAHLDTLAPSLANDDYMRRWWARYQRHSLSPGAAAVIQRMLFEADVRERLQFVQAPTLVVTRVDNRFIVPDHGRYLAEHIPNARLAELPGEDHVFFAGDTDALVDEIEGFVTGSRRGSDSNRLLTTMLFTDIVDSTARAAEIGDRAWRTLLNRHHAAVREELARFRGREIDTAGDGFFATFDSPARGVRCAVRIIEAAADLGLEIRAGVHTAEVEVHADGLAGVAVHGAARVASLAGPGEVLVTATVRDLVAGSGLEFEDRGRQALKGVPDTWQVYAVQS
jgi:class 3 adenylate cyclase